LVLADIAEVKLTTLKMLWKTNVPSKVSIFGWRLLLEKLPTKDALFHKGVLTVNQERCCAFCSDSTETIDHLFINCRVTMDVWSRIFT
jgi:hypothetical protein